MSEKQQHSGRRTKQSRLITSEETRKSLPGPSENTIKVEAKQPENNNEQLKDNGKAVIISNNNGNNDSQQVAQPPVQPRIPVEIISKPLSLYDLQEKTVPELNKMADVYGLCLLYTSPSPRDS